MADKKGHAIAILFIIALVPAICLADNLKDVLLSAGQVYVPEQKGDLDLEYSLGHAQNTHDDYGFFSAKYRFTDVKVQDFRNTLSFSYGLFDRLSLDAAFPYVHKRVTYKSETYIAKESEYDFGDISANIKIKLAADPLIHLNIRYYMPTGSKPYDTGPYLYQQKVSPYLISFIDWYNGIRISDKALISQFYKMNLATGNGHHLINPAVSVSKEFGENIAFGMVAYKHYLDSKEILVAEDLSLNLNSSRFTRTSQSQYAVFQHRLKIQPGDTILAQIGYILWASQTFSFHAGFDYAYFFKTTLSVPKYEIKDWDYSAFGWFGGAGLHFIPNLPVVIRLSAGTADGDPVFTSSLRLAYLFKI